MTKAPIAAPQSCRGFTLVEVLVVVVIISVVIAATVLSVNTTGKDRELEQERDRLTTLLAYVRERAELQTREYGLLASASGYQWLVYEPRQMSWLPDDLDASLRSRTLPTGLSLSLEVDGHEVESGESRLSGSLNASATQQVAPQLMLYSNGDLPNFALRIARLDPPRAITITVDAAGKIAAGAVVSEAQ